MHDPAAHPIDIEEQRTWLIDHKESTGASWSELSKRLNIPSGTLSQFGSEKHYAGDERKLAEAVQRYRQLLSSQARIQEQLPEVPDYFETPTGSQIIDILGWAQRGRIVVVATGAGLGKTKAADHFRACYPNVFKSTMSPSKAGVNNMQQEVLKALGERDAVGTPQKLSQRICDRVRDLRNPLIIIDEAQHLSEKAVEEIRSWHDDVGVGIALMGNISVMQRLEGGARAPAYAQLFSRVSMRLVRTKPLAQDVQALADAWSISDRATFDKLTHIAMTPGALRGATMALELAAMMASGEGKVLGAEHLQDAWAMLSQRAMAA